METFSIIKLFSGFNIFNGAKLGKLVFYFVLIAIALGIYHKTFLMRTIRQDIKAETVIIQAQDKSALFLGIKLWKAKIGIIVE